MITGIYKILSPSGKVYIGQAIDIIKRQKQYKKLNCKGQPKLYNSLNKYGPDKHIFEIIEECSLKQLDKRETYWKKYYLNLVDNDWSKILFCELYDRGGGPKSELTKKKMRKPRKNTEKMKGYSNFKGKFHTQEHKNFMSHKISILLKGKEKHTEESKLVFRKNLKEQWNNPKFINNVNNGKIKIRKIIFQYDLEGNLIKEWKGIGETSKILNINKRGICNCLSGVSKTSGGFIWKFKN